MHYVGAIFVTGAGLWLLTTITMFISPPSDAGICGPPGATCCVMCAVYAWFTFVPMFGFLLALILFLPGHLLVSWTARRATWWQPLYWLAGWVVTALIAAVLFSVALWISDRKIIALNISNGILGEMARQLILFATLFAVFGLLCGVCYWVMLTRAVRATGT
jgi:hypothetical protein